ncbi:MAG: triose-phosphate isomerase [Coriobacteriales bacterium]|nr:triose-phosphate isomerase [Coriobacteriales bacterium]
MTRRPLVAGNWKMHKTASEATRLIQQLAYSYDDAYAGVDVVVCPPFTALRSAQVTLDFDTNSPLRIGAQDVFWEPSGAYTGAISAAMLRDVACSFCIVGHSERRKYFSETDEDVARKAAALTGEGIAPIICCGETIETRESGGTVAFVTAQIEAALALLSASDAEPVVLAYEPVWAIGTGRTPTPEQADEVCAALRDCFRERYGAAAGEAVRILYGGSMNIGNGDAFAAMPNIDGGLVGGASLEAESFMALVKAFS